MSLALRSGKRVLIESTCNQVNQEGGYTGMYEVVCPDCGDHPDLDYSEISPRLQWLRGPHRLEAALAVFHKHQGIPWPTPGT